MHDSLHTVRITNNNNYKYTEEILNILESLGAAFDDPVCFILLNTMTRAIYGPDDKKNAVKRKAKRSCRRRLERKENRNNNKDSK